MDTVGFEAGLKADGFTEIEKKRLDARPANGEHGHHWHTRGLILDGAFTLTCGGSTRTYRPGDVFEVAAGELHFEEVGTGGVELVIGKKY